MTLSTGKLRGMQRIAGANGIFTMCAMDHRGSLADRLCADAATDDCRQDMADFKEDLCRILSPHASAVLLDPIFGAAQAVSGGLLARQTGLLVSLEESGYHGGREARETTLLSGWSVAKIKRMAADAVKLLVYYRPDLDSLAARQRELVQQVAEECRRHDLPCIVEAVSYPIGQEVSDPVLFARHKPEIVIQTARDLTPLAIDVLKAEFPADLNHAHSEREAARLCQALDAASSKPWVILSAGVDYKTFTRHITLACRAGASGYLAGRAVWQEAIDMADAPHRQEFLKTTAVARLKKLSAIARKYAAPWHRKLGLNPHRLAAITTTWYKGYGETET